MFIEKGVKRLSAVTDSYELCVFVLEEFFYDIEVDVVIIGNQNALSGKIN